MKKVLGIMIIALFAFTLASAEVVKVIEDHDGDITLKKGIIKIKEDGDVSGNITLDEGEIFIAKAVTIEGSIHVKKGNIFVEDNLDLSKGITVDEGHITIAKNSTIKGDIFCKKGIVKIGANGTVHGKINYGERPYLSRRITP